MAKAEKTKRSPEEHTELIYNLFGKLRRDIFTGDLCYYNTQTKRWSPLLHEVSLGKLKAVAIREGRYTLSWFEPLIYEITYHSKGEFLCPIKKWDGVDRLAQIAKCIQCKNFDFPVVENLLKHWCATIFARLHNPNIQNRILVLKGDQGIGKDYLMEQMFSALGQYFVPFMIQQQERDTFQQLISGLIMHIAEYDRTRKTDVATLKNMITIPRAFFRSAYGRVPMYHDVRATFVATCNIDDILRDWTGNRRYIIFEIDRLSWDYPTGASEQIIAQCYALYKQKYELTEASLTALNRHIEEGTPEDPKNIMCDLYEQMFAEEFGESCLYVPGNRITKLLSDCARKLGWGINYVRHGLKMRGYVRRTKHGVTYYATPMTDDQPESTGEFETDDDDQDDDLDDIL